MNSEYWANRQVALTDKLICKSEKELRSQYKRLYDELKAELQKLYKGITSGEENLKSDLYKYNKIYDLMNGISQKLGFLSTRQELFLAHELKDMYKQNWNLLNENSALIYSKFSEEQALKAVETVWCNDGLKFSDRVWKNSTNLNSQLEQVLLDGVAKGDSISKMARNIQAVTSAGFHNATRLARTELAHIMNASTMDKYEEAGITEYEVLVEPDACDDCKALIGKRFPITEPFDCVHPNCRCCAIPIIKRGI